MTHDKTIGLHGVESVYGVEQGFAFFQTGRFGLEVHRVRAETGGGGAEADARTRGIFKEGEGYGFAAKSGEFFERMALDFLKRLALVEKKSKFVRDERFESEKVAKAVGHVCTR
jgi:hypothetical protein